MIASTMQLVSANGAELEVAVRGAGQPAVLIQTALVADEFLPLASEPALRDHYQVIRYHRRGYAGSSRSPAPPGPRDRSRLAGRDRACRAGRAGVERDTGTFVETDLPALLAWQFDAEAARRITQPTLHIAGSESGVLFAEVRDLVRAWLPRTEDVVLTGADHSLAITHATDIAAVLVDFLQRHPLG